MSREMEAARLAALRELVADFRRSRAVRASEPDALASP